LRQSAAKAGIVVDYSIGVICADLSNFYANKVTIICDLVMKSEADGKILHEILGLNLFVRWGRKGSAGFRHGLGLSDESAARFNSLIAESQALGQTKTKS
jgi:hypothetical protein